MDTTIMCIIVITGIALFFVGRCLGYREALDDLCGKLEQIMETTEEEIKGDIIDELSQNYPR